VKSTVSQSAPSLIDLDWDTPVPQSPTSFGNSVAPPPQSYYNPFDSTISTPPISNPFPPSNLQATNYNYNPFAPAVQATPSNQFGGPMQVSQPNGNPFDFAFDPLTPPPVAPSVVSTTPMLVPSLDVFELPTVSKTHGTDQFDFPSLKHPTQSTDTTHNIPTLQPPPSRSTLVKPSPIKNMMMPTTPPTKAKNIESHSSEVPVCPLCGARFPKDVTNVEINTHVDSCLSESSIDAISTGIVTSKKKDSYPPTLTKKPSSNNNLTSPQSEEPWGQWFDLSKMDWYYGSIDRPEAEKILSRCTEDSFLVRKSSVKDAFAISLYNHRKQTTTHSLVEPRNGGYAFQDHQKVYPTLLDLVTNSSECKGLSPPPKTSVRLEF